MPVGVKHTAPLVRLLDGNGQSGGVPVESGLSFEVFAGADATVIAVAGEVDMATAPQLAQYLRENADQNVVLDLSRVSFLDSSGLSVLVTAYREAREAGRTLRTSKEHDIIRTVLEATDLFDMLHLNGEAPSD
jgi:anti-sigma B factor antagonist